MAQKSRYDCIAYLHCFQQTDYHTNSNFVFSLEQLQGGSSASTVAAAIVVIGVHWGGAGAGRRLSASCGTLLVRGAAGSGGLAGSELDAVVALDVLNVGDALRNQALDHLRLVVRADAQVVLVEKSLMCKVVNNNC